MFGFQQLTVKGKGQRSEIRFKRIIKASSTQTHMCTHTHMHQKRLRREAIICNLCIYISVLTKLFHWLLNMVLTLSCQKIIKKSTGIAQKIQDFLQMSENMKTLLTFLNVGCIHPIFARHLEF